MMRWRAVLLGLVLAALPACARKVEPGVRELTYATPYSPGHPFSRADQAWMDFVAERSGGKLVIRPIWAGALLSSEHSIEELRHGVADIGLITPIYTRGGAHRLRTQSGFYAGVATIPNQLALYGCMVAADPELEGELGGLVVLAVQGGSLPGILTRSKPVRSLADLKGLRLRAPSELLPVLRRLGADPVNMPMGEVYSALAKGVIDGVVAPPDTFRSLHFAEVADHFAPLRIARGAYPARAVGGASWDRLNDDERAILQESRKVWEDALSREILKAVEAGVAAADKAGVIWSEISAEDQAAFDAAYLEAAQDNARALERFGIDGEKMFAIARASVGADGNILCNRASQS